MTFGFCGEMLKSQLNIRLECRGEVRADDLDLRAIIIRMQRKAGRLSVIIKGASVGGKEIKIKEKMNIKEIKGPGELPSWEVDEMSRGNTTYKENKERVMFQKPSEGRILRREHCVQYY